MRYIYVILTVLILSSACNAQSSPNTPPAATLPASPNTPPVVQPTTAPTTTQPTIMSSDEVIRIARAELERDTYKQAWQESQKSFDNIKWVIQVALTAIGLILAIFGLVLFKNTKEFKESVADARKACEKAEEWEEKARAAFEKIDIRVESKLKEIDERVEIKLEQIEKQGNKSLVDILNERQISELWKTALRLDKEGNHDEATKKYAELNKLQKGSAAYRLACMCASRDEGKCREWLLVGQEAGTLPTRDEAMKDSDLDSVRDEAWFKAIKWKGER